MSGMRLAQLAKVNPWQKKKTDTAIRTRDLLCDVVIVSAVVKFKFNSKNNLIHSRKLLLIFLSFIKCIAQFDYIIKRKSVVY